MPHRRRNWLWFAAFIFLWWLIHPIYVRNLEAFIEERGWDQLLNRLFASIPQSAGEMSNYFNELFTGSGFWAGAFVILMAWGLLEFSYAWLRKRRRSNNPFLNPSTGLAYGTSAYVDFVPETFQITDSRNISSVTDNGTGDFTFNFDLPLTKVSLRVTPTAGTPWPKDTIIDEKATKVHSVRVTFKNEPDRISLFFES